MTTQELNDLNRICAEKVMGWKVRLEIKGEYSLAVCSKDVPADVRGKAVRFSDAEICIGSFTTADHPDRDAYHYLKFEPVDDPAAAMLVLEACGKKLDDGAFSHGILITYRDGMWLVSSQGTAHNRRTGDPLPLAIAKFAVALFEKEGK